MSNFEKNIAVLSKEFYFSVKQKKNLSILLRGAGEIREAANLINRGNIFQEISEHFLRNTRITIFIPFERSKHMGLRKKINIEWGKL